MTGQLEESENQEGDTQPEMRGAALWPCCEGEEAGKHAGEGSESCGDLV